MDYRSSNTPSGDAVDISRDLSTMVITDISESTASAVLNNKLSSDVQEQSTPTQHDPTIRSGPQIDDATKMVQNFLLKHEPEFVRCHEFRTRGWTENREMGDAFFKNQRERADNATAEERKRFHDMMVQIANEMHTATGALDVQGSGSPMKVLDICMAPGGYTEALLRHNPRAKAFGITLPEKVGGHPLVIEKSKLSGLAELDVTNLIKEYSDNIVPDRYPKKSDFSIQRPFRFHKFDLVFCDGKVLREHIRPSYREETEAIRLTHSQLILAMQRIATGGTLVILLHKCDHWSSIKLLHVFSKFSKVQLFKPKKKHATRSSFYLIAKDVQPETDTGKAALKQWRDMWWMATFGGPECLGIKPKHDHGEVVNVLEEFGGALMALAAPAWKIQGDALSRTDYAGHSTSGLWTPSKVVGVGSEQKTPVRVTTTDIESPGELLP